MAQSQSPWGVARLRKRRGSCTTSRFAVSSQKEDPFRPNRLISLYFHSSLGVATSTDPFKGRGLYCTLLSFFYAKKKILGRLAWHFWHNSSPSVPLEVSSSAIDAEWLQLAKSFGFEKILKVWRSARNFKDQSSFAKNEKRLPKMIVFLSKWMNFP